MLKAIFIAPSYRQADYWANQWGYRESEWKYVSTRGEEHKLFGYHESEILVFYVGTRFPDYATDFQIRTRGFTVYDGQDLR